MPKYTVIPLGLNLRSRPVLRASTRMAVLPQGHEVTSLNDVDDGWIKVETVLKGQEIQGFLAFRFLLELEEPDDGVVTIDESLPEEQLPPAHLQQDRSDIKRSRAGGRAYPLGESSRPTRGSNPTAHIGELNAIVDWLKVNSSARYKPTSSSTYCNIYAYDYCYLADAYLPRVWWTNQALRRLRQGEMVTPKYGNTVRELNANSLHDWLEDFGADYQWERLFDFDELQNRVNLGQIGVICAQRVNLNASGHISVVIPESAQHQARRVQGRVTSPLQSQAGRTNRKRFVNIWWTHEKFRDWGLWVHP